MSTSATSSANEAFNLGTLMIQGCTSDAGKSVMVAGLCRLLANKGVSVAPFKPQNMALNSAVSSDGGEIGRAQAVQAQACYLEPHTDMNPILLKPNSDTGAQVIVHGHAIQSMQAGAYHDYKKIAMDAVLQSHARLSERYQAVIVEGAGSPAEINLRKNDIANMGFAEAVDCPVILIADIDRGGVFAHLVGTLELLSQSEQDRVIGFIINRFRGDIGLLEPGLRWLEEKTNKPVLGVVPYLTDFFLDAEDAIYSAQVKPSNDTQSIKVLVPVLPRISNHTDFDALRMHPNVDLQFVAIDQELPYSNADLIILPGSKNVLNDLNALKNAGWETLLNTHLRYGGKILGICGGYQMLGNTITDPGHIESQLGEGEGFGFIDAQTVLNPKKKLQQVSGNLIAPQLLSDEQHAIVINGYEIHCGETEIKDSTCSALVRIDSASEQDTHLDGVINADNNVVGCYLHGLFDTPSSANALLSWAGLRPQAAPDLNLIREQQLDRLANCLHKELDLAKIIGPDLVDSPFSARQA